MRILATAFLLAMASASAQASSIIVIGDDGEVDGNSVSVITAGSELARSPSVLVIGPAEIAAVESEDMASEAEPMVIAPLPMVIRAGIEGEAFTRAISPDGTGSEQMDDEQQPQAVVKPQKQEGAVEAKAPSAPVAPRAPVDPIAQPQAVREQPAPPPPPEPQPIEPTATVD
ncbi:MAG: hypothetical protein M9955_16230 [Rhizobiaceae bacterium]|nr:hypothetical protein [Rhizobiaceae bacterium]